MRRDLLMSGDPSIQRVLWIPNQVYNSTEYKQRSAETQVASEYPGPCGRCAAPELAHCATAHTACDNPDTRCPTSFLCEAVNWGSGFECRPDYDSPHRFES